MLGGGAKTVNGVRAHFAQVIGDVAWGAREAGMWTGGRERGLTGPGLPSSLTCGLSSSREAVRLSFLD